MTIVLVSHGSTPLRLCETILRMEDGRLRQDKAINALATAQMGRSRA